LKKAWHNVHFSQPNVQREIRRTNLTEQGLSARSNWRKKDGKPCRADRNSDQARFNLMKWHEPNAYSRKDLSQYGRRIGLFIFLMIPSICLLISAVSHTFSKGRIILALIFMLLGIIAFLRIWFGPGDMVHLTEHFIIKGSGTSKRKSFYKFIQSCNVHIDSYNNATFSILKFTVKKGLPPGQITEVVVPNKIILERVLQILRDKGIDILGEQVD
jgi:hypothetical protein